MVFRLCHGKLHFLHFAFLYFEYGIDALGTNNLVVYPSSHKATAPQTTLYSYMLQFIFTDACTAFIDLIWESWIQVPYVVNNILACKTIPQLYLLLRNSHLNAKNRLARCSGTREHRNSGCHYMLYWTYPTDDKGV